MVWGAHLDPGQVVGSGLEGAEGVGEGVLSGNWTLPVIATATVLHHIATDHRSMLHRVLYVCVCVCACVCVCVCVGGGGGGGGGVQDTCEAVAH